MSKYLYGIHDSGGEHLMADAPGTIVYTIDVRNDAPIDFRKQASAGHRAIARLNWSHHGQGSIPPNPADWPRFAEMCATFAERCRGGVRDFTIANEVNIKAEWGREEPVTPEQYAECYRLVYDAMKGRAPNDSIVQIAPAAVGPWNVESGIGWIEYFQRMLAAIGSRYVDWINLHTYSRGYNPSAITDNARMDVPYQHFHKGFRAYLDFLTVVPPDLRDKPIDITETNGDGEWPNENTGWVQEAYTEIVRHNRLVGTQKIRSLCLFRWKHFDGQPWGFEHKPNIHEDFRAAVAERYLTPDKWSIADKPDVLAEFASAAMQYRSPDPAARPAQQPDTEQIHIPTVSGPSAPPSRQWDKRLDGRGVKIETPDLKPGDTVWRVREATWLDEQQAGGRHHIYVDVRDSDGSRLTNIPLRVTWPSGSARIVTESKPGEPWATSHNMSPSRNEYSIRVDEGGFPSETVTGIGMGADTPGGFNPGIHTSTGLVFERVRIAQNGGQVTQPATVPRLVHPVYHTAFRRVTQPFGVNPERYARFGLDGHNGIDFGTPVGAVVRAVADGQVVEVLDNPSGYGLYVKLRHRWGESIYAHLSQQSVTQGASVKAGQVIGLSGNTGNSTGPHLHFGMRVFPYKRGRPFDGYIDPAPYLRNTIEPGQTQPQTDNIPAIIREAAREFGLNENLLLSLCWKESSFNPRALSPVGARGLGQIMSPTWGEWAPKVGASNILDARDNARVSAAYLNWCIQTAGSVRRGLWSYVWGIGNVTAGTGPPAVVLEYANAVIHGRDLLNAVGD